MVNESSGNDPSLPNLEVRYVEAADDSLRGMFDEEKVKLWAEIHPQQQRRVDLP